MILLYVMIFGLILGSFINALVWRLHQQLDKDGNPKKGNKKYSIMHGRSICPNCKHKLSTADLFPVFSWLLLRGKCRYCKKPISVEYPLVELLTGLLFGLSYIFWPYEPSAASWAVFLVWLLLLTGLITLVIYDARWKLLPNRVIYPLIALSALATTLGVIFLDVDISVLSIASSVSITSGVFYLLYIISDGRWIGGGDVKYGLIPGILLVDPFKAFLYLMFASLLGSLVVGVGLALRKVTPKSQIPFGPFLIFSTVLLYIFGGEIIDWYETYILLTGAV